MQWLGSTSSPGKDAKGPANPRDLSKMAAEYFTGNNFEFVCNWFITIKENNLAKTASCDLCRLYCSF